MDFSYQPMTDKIRRILFTALAAWLLSSAFALPAWSQETPAAAAQSNFSIARSGAEPVPYFSSEPFMLEQDELLFNPYDLNDLEPAIDSGIRFQEAGQHETAVEAFEQALQIVRIRYGLYSETQVPILEGIINSGMALKDWELVDRRYAYMENLYRKLYALDDPRLEHGLQKISSFHVNAFNINLDGRREYHLRRAAMLFQTRLQVAENTLAVGHPRFDYLNEGIAISRQHLYLMTTSYRERLNKKQGEERDNLLADLD